ncbi:hypothetical protein, partial [Rhizobium johnstonii]|uniref:hypothetical protein n=1 Tax=Rhizobium johnstonii TaxID=3019933 RepID=UPI003F997F9C
REKKKKKEGEKERGEEGEKRGGERREKEGGGERRKKEKEGKSESGNVSGISLLRFPLYPYPLASSF